MWILRDFPDHLLFYRVVGDDLEIVRVPHGARDVSSILGEEG